MRNETSPTLPEAHDIKDELTRRKVMQISAKIYLAIAAGAAVLFYTAANLSGYYSLVAKLGGTIWVGLLTLIIAMPLVTDRVKKRLKS